MSATIRQETAVPTGSGDAALSVRNLWKIFGKGADKVIGSPDAELSRAELQKTDCVGAVRGVSFDVSPGEVFVVMGGQHAEKYPDGP